MQHNSVLKLMRNTLDIERAMHQKKKVSIKILKMLPFLGNRASVSRSPLSYHVHQNALPGKMLFLPKTAKHTERLCAASEGSKQLFDGL